MQSFLVSLWQYFFFPGHFAGPADFLALPHTGTLAQLIIKYPDCHSLGKKEKAENGVEAGYQNLEHNHLSQNSRASGTAL